MSNSIITNKQASILDLSPLRDTAATVIVLRPKGSKGDSCVVSQETADSEVAARARTAGWIEIAAAGTDAASTAPEITPEVTPEVTPETVKPVETVTPAPLPPVEEPKAIVEEASADMPTETTTTSETPVEDPSRTYPSENTPKSKRR